MLKVAGSGSGGGAASGVLEQEAGSTAPNADAGTKRMFIDSEKNDLISAIDENGNVTIIDEYIDEVQTTAANLETNYPAADYEGMFAIVNGTTSDNGGYLSNGSLWGKQWDETGDPTDLPSYGEGISYLTTDELANAQGGTWTAEDDAGSDVPPFSGAYEIDNLGDAVLTSVANTTSVSPVRFINVLAAPKALGQFVLKVAPYTVVTNTAKFVKTAEIYGFDGVDTFTLLNILSVGGDGFDAGSDQAQFTAQHSSGLNTYETMTINTSNVTEYAGYAVRVVDNWDATLDIRLNGFEAFESVDATALVTTNGDIKLIHAGYSKGTAGTAKIADSTLTNNDYIIEVDSSGGAFTQTLPAVADVKTGKRYLFKKVGTGTNAVTLDGDGSETIDGATTNATALVNQYDYIEIYNNGTEWLIIN